MIPDSNLFNTVRNLANGFKISALVLKTFVLEIIISVAIYFVNYTQGNFNLKLLSTISKVTAKLKSESWKSRFI